VCRELGTGFLEAVYENALALELEEKGILFERQYQLDVCYKSQLIGQYKADLIVEGKLIIELKAVPEFKDRHKAQVLNYLRQLV
jgi:GxxExxY protein